MKVILITGVNGYIGSKAAKALLEKGCFVIGIDLNAPESDYFAGYKNYIFFKIDITDDKTFPDEFNRADVLIHCAALVHKSSNCLSRENYFKINYQGTKNILDFINKKKLEQIIFLSTVSVYGELDGYNIPDEENRPKPDDFYGESKLAAENYIKEYGRINNVPYTILRLTPVYGKLFLLNINKRIYLPWKNIFYKISSGEQKISLCSVNNIVEVMANCVNDQRYFNEIFIVKDKKDYSFNEIIDIFKEIYSQERKPIIRIPLILPKIVFYLLYLVFPKRGKFYQYQFKKIALNSIYSGEKLHKKEPDINWELKNTLMEQIKKG